MQNRSFVPLSWGKVALAIAPGLIEVSKELAVRISIVPYPIVQRVHEPLRLYGLPVACISLIIIGLLLERRVAAWTLPALGILLLSILPGAALDLLLPESNTQLPPAWYDLVVNLSLFALWGVIAAIGLKYRRDLHMPKLGWVVLALTILTSPVMFLLLGAVLLLPMAIGLPLVRRNGFLAGLIVVAGVYLQVNRIFDPEYGLLIWTSNDAAYKVVAVLPAISFLVVSPIWMLRSRATHGQLWGLLLPASIALLSGEAIRSVLLRGTGAEYSLSMWLTRGLGAAQFVLVLALAAVIYQSFGHRGQATNNTQENTMALSQRATG